MVKIEAQRLRLLAPRYIPSGALNCIKHPIPSPAIIDGLGVW